MTGIDQIKQVFDRLKSRREKALVTYIMAGDPDLKTTARLISCMSQAGADIIELGVPFSDPSADGPVIQRASVRSLDAQTNPPAILRMIREVKKEVATPLVLMSYYNPILQYGLQKFCQDAASAGVAGLIVPDLPFEEAGPLFIAAEPVGLAIIPLVAPTTSKPRLTKITAKAQGFIYCVTVTGITGTKQNVTKEIVRLSGEVREITELPIVAGFGIATPEQAASVAAHCDGVVVGSALVKVVEEQTYDCCVAVASQIGRLKESLR